MKTMYIVNGFVKESLVMKRFYNKAKALESYKKLEKSFNKSVSNGIVEYVFDNGNLVSYKNITK